MVLFPGRFYALNGFLDAPDASGGGGAPDPGAGGATPSPPSDPQPIELADDALIRVKGSDKPIKFSEYGKGFQAQFTKASQRAAQLEKELQAREARLKEYEAEKSRLAAQLGGQQQTDVFAALRQLPYLSGEQAVEVVQNIGQQIQQRDQVLLATLKQLQQLKGVVDQLHGNHVNSSFEAKISKWLTDGGYPPEAADLAKEIYLAYTGDDLDSEFPQIFERRWNQVEKIVEARRQAKISAARKPAFVPGKGGSAGPTKPLQLDPKASARDVAAELWESLQGESET